MPARNQCSKGEEKGRARGGRARRPGEIAGGREEGERPGCSQSQPAGWDRVAWVVEAPGSTGVGPEGRRGSGGREALLSYPDARASARERVRTSDYLFNPLECPSLALIFGPLVFHEPLYRHMCGN